MLDHITPKMTRRPMTTVNAPIASTSSAMQGINKYMPGYNIYGSNNRPVPLGVGAIPSNYNNRTACPLNSMSMAQPIFNQQNLTNFKPQQWLPFNEPYNTCSDINTNFYKSNSLPRRRVQSTVNTIPRSVKWRNDLIDESNSIIPNLENSNLNYNNLNLPFNTNVHYSENVLNSMFYQKKFYFNNMYFRSKLYKWIYY